MSESLGRPKSAAFLPWALAGLLAWIIGYPLLATLIDAFFDQGRVDLGPLGEFLRRPDEWSALWRSLWISMASVVLAGAVGVPLAFLFERVDFAGRSVLGALVALPVALPPLVGVLAFLFLYGESGLLARGLQSIGVPVSWRLNGPGAILLVHAYSMYVYFYLFVRAALARLDGTLLEAAASLGASRTRTFFHVVLPALRPSLVAASLLVFMTALASFSAPYIFGGGFRVMTTQIVASKLNGDLGMAQIETLALAVLALCGLSLVGRLDPGADLRGGGRGTSAAPARRLGRWSWLVAPLGWVVTVLLLLPHLTLILLSFVPPHTWTVEAFPPVLDFSNYRRLATELERLRPVLNSLWMAGVSTGLALALGFAAARQSQRTAGRLGRSLEFLVVLPWAIPGTVFAIALATAFSAHQPWLGRVVLIGTPWILPLAYLVRSLPVTARSALAGMRQLDPAYEEAAASLGASNWVSLRRVVVPILRPALLAGAGLAFLTTLGDFVTSIVLYTYQTRPISIEILSSLRLQEVGVAAVYGVLLMILSATVFLLWGRRTAL